MQLNLAPRAGGDETEIAGPGLNRLERPDGELDVLPVGDPHRRASFITSLELNPDSFDRAFWSQPALSPARTRVPGAVRSTWQGEASYYRSIDGGF